MMLVQFLLLGFCFMSNKEKTKLKSKIYVILFFFFFFLFFTAAPAAFGGSPAKGLTWTPAPAPPVPRSVPHPLRPRGNPLKFSWF